MSEEEIRIEIKYMKKEISDIKGIFKWVRSMVLTILLFIIAYGGVAVFNNGKQSEAVKNIRHDIEKIENVVFRAN